MIGLLFLGLAVAVLVVLDYAALRWGVDSRSGFPDVRKPSGRLSLR